MEERTIVRSELQKIMEEEIEIKWWNKENTLRTIPLDHWRELSLKAHEHIHEKMKLGVTEGNLEYTIDRRNYMGYFKISYNSSTK